MPQYALRLPQDLYQRASDAARQQGVSLNQFFLYAVADMVAEVEARRPFAERLKGASVETARRHLGKILSQVPDHEPVSGDEIPVPTRRRRTPPRATVRT